MKNLLLLLSVLFFFANTTSAQESQIIGQWNLTKMQKGDKVKTVDSGVIFEEGGITKLGFFNMEEIVEAGTWEYNSGDNSITMTSTVDKSVNGKAKIIKLTDDELQYQKEGIIYSLAKYVENEESDTQLNFTIDDFFDENGDYKYYGDEEKLPWQNPLEMITELKNVNQLVFKFSVLNEETQQFDSKVLTANVEANTDDETLSIDFIFFGYDRFNLPEDADLPPNKEYANLLYPEKENSFRVAGAEQITCPAGTFDCTVVEAADDFEESKRMWMITDKPGVYAKIVASKRGNFGHYHIYELQEIK